MTGTMRNLFISSKEFKAEALNVQGYDINQISLRKAKKDKFSEKLDVKVDMQQVLSALENKGYVYAFAKKGRIKALYISRKDGDTISCNEIFVEESLENEPIVNLMDQQVAFLLAQRVSAMKNGVAVFRGQTMPKLTVRAGKYNWWMCCAMSLMFLGAYTRGFQDWRGAGLAVLMGFLMGLCFTEHFYVYESSDVTTDGNAIPEETKSDIETK